jgi:hypothetical protein
MTPLGIEPATLQLVVQCLNQLPTHALARVDINTQNKILIKCNSKLSKLYEINKQI